MTRNRLYEKHKSRFNIFKNIIFVLTGFILINFFLIQVIFSNSFNQEILEKTVSSKLVKGKRGNIYDRNNNVLAYSEQKITFFTNTNKISDSEKNKISNLFSSFFNKPKSEYDKVLNKKTNYLVIESNLIKNRYGDLIEKSNKIDALKKKYYDHRFYPYNNFAAQVIGYTKLDNNKGEYGVESYFEDILKPEEKIVQYNKTSRGRIALSENSVLPKNGADIYLTIDIEVQKILQNQLAESIKQDSAKSGNGIIVNPHNGKIIAMASIPDFDLNKYNELHISSADYDLYSNRVISQAYEPGSTFKIVCFANAIDNGLQKDYFCENGVYEGKYISSFNDHGEGYGNLKFNEIFNLSSNIGTIKIFEDLSKESFYKKIKNFGFGVETNISLAHEKSGDIYPFKYYLKNSRDLASASIGQSIKITNLQLAMAYCSIANGGYLLKPKIIEKINYGTYVEQLNDTYILNRTMDSFTSKVLVNFLDETVDEGTGKNAYLEEINLGGKTGTGEIWDKDNNKYSETDFFSSFASIFPIEDPKYVMIISIEAPEEKKKWGGESAAKCSKNIINNIIRYDEQLKFKNNIIDENA